MSMKYIKLLLGLFFLVLSNLFSVAQSGQLPALRVKQFQLKNGMDVYINPDPYATYVSGMIGVKTGAKYDPSDATGIAHYLEHMLFKGTESLGTRDYEKEVIYLDSIAIMYDSLALVSDKGLRDEIHAEINRLSLEAGKFAIPNEMDLLLDEMGSKGVNAFTGYEMNAYFNRFPANQLDKWLKLYAHRFEKPVFRLFQSELETVFEEKNMYMDQFEVSLMEAFFREFYKKHPYGQQSILGEAEHIKNPSLTKMQQFYDTYYVANNMVLILSGPLDVNEAFRKVEAAFGQLPTGKVPEFHAPEEVPFMYHETHTERLTPIRAGLIGFRTVPVNHPDRAGLDVLHALLSNANETGMLDRLGNENRLMYSLAFNDQRADEGGSIFLYVPRVFFQRMSKAEDLVLSRVDSIKAGNFSNESLQSVKKALVKENQQMFESVTDRSLLLLNGFIYGESWDETVNYHEKLSAVSKQDVIKLANTYYGDNYLVFRSRMGFPKKDKLKKPGYDPVQPEDKQAESAFARRLKQVPEGQLNPDYIDIGDEVSITDLTSSARLFFAENPVNEIFHLDLRFEISRFESPFLISLSMYLIQAGSRELPELEFREKLQSLGASLDATAGDRYFSVEMTGFESDLDSSLFYLNQLLHEVALSETALDRLVQWQELERRYEKHKPDIKADALTDYIMYGEQSEYLSRLSKKELGHICPGDLSALLDTVLQRAVEIHYSGKLEEFVVREKLQNNLVLPSGDGFGKLYERELKTYDEPTIFFINDKKSRAVADIFLHTWRNR